MEISKKLAQQVMEEFHLNAVQRIPFSFERKYRRAVIDDAETIILSGPEPVWKSEFQNDSGARYICGIANEHICAIARECSSRGEYGLIIQTQDHMLSLASGHLINISHDKWLPIAYDSKQDFINKNPSNVIQDLFLHHSIISGKNLFTADIVYRAIYDIIKPLLFNQFVEKEKAQRRISNSEPIKIIGSLFAQDTYLHLIFENP
ncbi:MAG: hypothetical protein V1866_06045 [archaeon]